MASIRPLGNKFRVQVYVQGRRDSNVCATRKEAAQWALEREAELRGTKLPDKTFGDAMARFAKEDAPKRGGGHWEVIRLRALGREPIALRRIASLGAEDFARWRDVRLTQVKPGTVAREMTLLRAVLELARKEWKWIRDKPMADVRWPECPKGRARRISPEEVEAVARAFGVWDQLQAESMTNRVGLAFLFALETAMRSGEILGLTWPNIHLKDRYVHIPRSKNGDARDVPLTMRAVEILKALPLGFGPVFGLEGRLRDALFRKYRPTHLRDLHFHDTRAEAVWRLSKKLDVLQLARVIGHRDLKSLMHYYAESAADMAMRLG